MIKRYRMAITTDTGTAGTTTVSDTGPNTFGRIVQIRVHQVAADTGGDLEIGLYPDLKNATTQDTGTGFLIYSGSDVLGSDILGAPSMSIFNAQAASTDTGAAYVYAAGESLRCKVTAGQTAVAGGNNQHLIWVYVDED
jgi:hypothetical protein